MMIKHTQAICTQELTNCLSVFEHFVALPLKEIKQEKHVSSSQYL